MDERIKQQLMVGVVFFNVTLMGYMLYAYLFGPRVFVDGLLVRFAIGAGIGLVAGVIGFFIGGMMNK